MKKRLLIGLTSALLAVTLCLGFASCETDDKKLTDQEIAASAIDHVKQQYDDSAKLETPEDYEVESKAPAADGNSYNVTYTVAATDEGVTIGDYVVVGDSTDGKTKISVIRGTVDVNYTLNASVTVNSATASVAIAKKVPALAPVVGGDDDKTPTDEEKAQSILNGLSLTKTSFNTSGEEVTLPTSTEAGVTVVWSVKDGNTEDYVSIENNTLTIEKLPEEGGDVTVTLSVSVKVGESTVSKPVTITLSPAPVVHPTDDEMQAALTTELNKVNNISINEVKPYNLPTPAEDSNVTFAWNVEGETQLPEGITLEAGKIVVSKLPATQTVVTLKVTATYGDNQKTDSKTITVTIAAAPVTGPTDEDMQAAITAELDQVNDIAITEVKTYDLPAPTDNKITFSWAVKSGSAQFPDGITFNTNQINVSHLPETQTTVTLELTATYVGTQKTDTKEVTVTISAAEPAGPDDQEKANEVLQSLQGQFDSITKEYSATTSEPVSLPTSTQDGATVTWTVDSGSEYASITDGYKLSITKLPTYKEEDATVTLTVTVNVNGKTATDTVTITVHKAQPTDQDKANDVLDSLDIDGIVKTYDASAQDVQLPATSDLATQYSANIKWTVEGDSAYISISEDNKLSVNSLPAYKAGEQKVTIKVTVSVNDATASTTVEITLKEAAPTDEEKAQEALASLNIDAFEPNVFEVLDEEGKTALPTTSATVTKYSANVEWKVDGTSDYVQIKNNKIAIIALPKDGDKEVTLTVTVTVGQVVVSDSITITVKKEVILHTASVVIAEYAKAHNWAQGDKNGVVALDNNIKATTTPGSQNNGGLYNKGTEWRLYQSDIGDLTITALNDATIHSITITYGTDNGGYLSHSGAKVKNATKYIVNAASIEMKVTSDTATNGQVKITAIKVEYEGGTEYTDDVKIEEALAELDITATSLIEDLPLPKITVAGVTLAWEVTKGASNAEVKPDDEGGYILHITRGEADVPVTLKVTASCGEANPQEKTFEDLVVVGIPAAGSVKTVDFDLTTNFSTYAKSWGNSYATKNVEFSSLMTDCEVKGKVTFNNISKQTGTIKDRPVYRTPDDGKQTPGYITVELTGTETFDSVSFELKEWSDSKKFNKICIEYYDTNTSSWVAIGDNFVHEEAERIGENGLTLKAEGIPANVSSVRLQIAGSAKCQVALSKITLGVKA